jgi:hypothetical protein
MAPCEGTSARSTLSARVKQVFAAARQHHASVSLITVQ